MSSEEWSDDEIPLIQDSDFSVLPYPSQSTLKYTILSPKQISHNQESLIQDIMSIFGFSYYQSISLSIVSWWSIQEASRIVIDGHSLDFLCLSPISSSSPSKSKSLCQICLKKKSPKRFYDLQCGHSFCRRCLKSYLNDAVSQGIECLRTTCPEFSCNLYITGDLYEYFLSEDHFTSYKTYLQKSYVNYNDRFKWCPNPKCENAVEILQDVKEILCSCGYFWCILCGNEGHRPISCEKLNEWNIINNGKEENNELWITANSKKCSACMIPIQKNQGCIHMTCKCGNEFCWLCLGSWKDHNSNTGGTGSCTIYKEKVSKGENLSEEVKKQEAAQVVHSFNYYTDKYLIHKKLINSTLQKRQTFLQLLETVHKSSSKSIDASFFQDAIELILQARTGLCHSYSLGYFISDLHKLSFNEFLQQELENEIEIIERCTDIDLLHFLLRDLSTLEFNILKGKVLNLMNRLKSNLNNCLEQMEQQFPDIHDSVKTPEMDKSLKEFITRKYYKENEDWSCSACSFINPGSVRECGICMNSRT